MTITDEMVEAAARALGDSLCRRPYGGYDYGYNEAFYGPAPEAGRYVVRCEKTDKIVHQTNNQADHDAAYENLTLAFHARAALEAALRARHGRATDIAPRNGIADRARPFTADELDKVIEDAETAFRIFHRAGGEHFNAGRLSDCTRCHTDAAETASILAELRYQRARLP